MRRPVHRNQRLRIREHSARVTDESWNAYLKQLEQYNYDYYIEFFNNKLHNSF